MIGTSENYKSASGRDNGIESVKKNAPEARVEDLTA
ncbi:MAG: YegP family protein [Henriciella sp.]|nr:YegP family protein [Henriciella sp.]